MRPGQQHPGNPRGALVDRGLCRENFNEAGATTPRKPGTGRDALRLPRATSMRPGQQHPGNPRFCSSRPPGRSRASMRPGQQHPGNRGRGTVHAPGGRRASMRPGQQHPGNRAPLSPPLRATRCFNEAGATTPRKPSHDVHLHGLSHAASMRPGQQHPGNLSGQWSPWITIGPASMRPGQQHPGNLHRYNDRRRVGEAASMRPGQQHPGNHHHEQAAWRQAPGLQ